MMTPRRPRIRQPDGPATSMLRRWTIPVIGAITPIGLIVVNIAAFIVHHLSSFQWILAVLAFVSGMMLNSWAGLNIYRAMRRRLPDHPLFGAHNEEVVLVAGMLGVTIASFATAFFCYKGLSDERDLPNRLTFLTGVISIVLPILLQALFRRGEPQPQPSLRSGGYPRDVTAYPPPPPGVGPPYGSYPPPPPGERRPLTKDGRR